MIIGGSGCTKGELLDAASSDSADTSEAEAEDTPADEGPAATPVIDEEADAEDVGIEVAEEELLETEIILKEYDLDGDGVQNLEDNCPQHANAGQEDLDEDWYGDACDPDWDGDDIMNTADRCPRVNDNNNADNDGDGVGDVCDDDDDNDGFDDVEDNCPKLAQNVQNDNDEDGLGDECDDDDDNDGVLDNAPDPCPLIANDSGDCPYDRDGDGIYNTYAGEIPDIEDNCPDVSNVDQEDLDSDGLGNVCDDDLDGDSIANGLDNCPYETDPDQTDTDGDLEGDLCDDDDDNDGIADASDACPLIPMTPNMTADDNPNRCNATIDNIIDTLAKMPAEYHSFTNGTDRAPTDTVNMGYPYGLTTVEKNGETIIFFSTYQIIFRVRVNENGSAKDTVAEALYYVLPSTFEGQAYNRNILAMAPLPGRDTLLLLTADTPVYSKVTSMSLMAIDYSPDGTIAKSVEGELAPEMSNLRMLVNGMETSAAFNYTFGYTVLDNGHIMVYLNKRVNGGADPSGIRVVELDSDLSEVSSSTIISSIKGTTFTYPTGMFVHNGYLYFNSGSGSNKMLYKVPIDASGALLPDSDDVVMFPTDKSLYAFAPGFGAEDIYVADASNLYHFVDGGNPTLTRLIGASTWGYRECDGNCLAEETTAMFDFITTIARVGNEIILLDHDQRTLRIADLQDSDTVSRVYPLVGGYYPELRTPIEDLNKFVFLKDIVVEPEGRFGYVATVYDGIYRFDIENGVLSNFSKVSGQSSTHKMTLFEAPTELRIYYTRYNGGSNRLRMMKVDKDTGAVVSDVRLVSGVTGDPWSGYDRLGTVAVSEDGMRLFYSISHDDGVYTQYETYVIPLDQYGVDNGTPVLLSSVTGVPFLNPSLVETYTQDDGQGGEENVLAVFDRTETYAGTLYRFVYDDQGNFETPTTQEIPYYLLDLKHSADGVLWSIEYNTVGTTEILKITDGNVKTAFQFNASGYHDGVGDGSDTNYINGGSYSHAYYRPSLYPYWFKDGSFGLLTTDCLFNSIRVIR
jgi:hypothetical protein